MGKTPGRRLKVFRAHLGFYETVVAAASRTAALRAWGTHQNLFADGQADVATDPQAVAAALAAPDVPLVRAIGSTDPFGRESKSLPAVPAAPKTAGARPGPKPAPATRKAPPDRSKLAAAEAALGRVDGDRKREEAALRRRQDDLDAEREAAQARYVEARKAKAAAVEQARAAYRAAGGRD